MYRRRNLDMPIKTNFKWKILNSMFFSIIRFLKCIRKKMQNKFLSIGHLEKKTRKCTRHILRILIDHNNDNFQEKKLLIFMSKFRLQYFQSNRYMKRANINTERSIFHSMRKYDYSTHIYVYRIALSLGNKTWHK